MSILQRKLIRLTPTDCWGVALAYLYLLCAGWHLFIRRQQIDRWVVRPPDPARRPHLTEADRNALASKARWVNAAARYPAPWARCLQRSLALCFWMERKGFQPVLKIGVRKEGASLQGHAWVEYGGKVLNDNPQAVATFTILAGAGLAWAKIPWEREQSQA